MSSLYESPAELRKNLAKSTQTGNWFQDTFTDAISGGLSVGDDGRVDREGLAWWLQGLTPGSESIARQQDSISKASTIDRLVQSSGLTEDEISKAAGGRKLTASNTQGIISKGTRDYQDRITPAERERIDATNKAQSDSTALGYATLQSQDKRYAHESSQADARRAFERSENKMDRRHSRESQTLTNDMNMQIALMNNELSEKRMAYDRETRSMDRRDKLIAQLMSGLGQLGGAFAL